jgi:hypothetical protein
LKHCARQCIKKGKGGGRNEWERKKDEENGKVKQKKKK